MKVPFRVMCINGIKPGDRGTAINGPSNSVGVTQICHSEAIFETETYTVTAVEEHFKALYYELLERNPEMIYHSSNFVVLPEQSADEMEEQEKEAIIYAR